MSTKPDTPWGNKHVFQADPINFYRCGLHKENPVHGQSPVMPSYEDLGRELTEAKRDSVRLDALEEYVNANRALLLHTGDVETKGFNGLGLRPGHLVRTLRQALDILVCDSGPECTKRASTREGGIE
jgi:hypothetical protein